MLQTVFLELTNHCNMNCAFCANQIMTRERGYMPPSRAKDVVDQLVHLNFQGSLISSLMGEPLLHPHFRDIAKYSVESGIKTNVITNMSLIPDTMTIEELLNIGIDRLCLSYHTPDENTYKLRHSSLLFQDYSGKVKDIVHYAINNPFKTGHIEIHIMHSLYNYMNVEVSDDYGLIESTVSGLVDFIYQNCRQASSLIEKRKTNKYLTRFKQGRQYLDEYEIPLFPRISVVLKRGNTWANALLPEGCTPTPKAEGTCDFFESSLGIFWDGRVTVCCQDFDAQMVIGDIRQNTIAEILKSRPLLKMRHMQKYGLLVHRYCRICKGTIMKNHREFSLVKPQGFVNKCSSLTHRIKERILRKFKQSL